MAKHNLRIIDESKLQAQEQIASDKDSKDKNQNTSAVLVGQ